MNDTLRILLLMALLVFVALPFVLPKQGHMARRMKEVRKEHHGKWLTYNELKELTGFEGDDFYNLLRASLLARIIVAEKDNDEVSQFQNRYKLKPLAWWE